MTIFLKKGEDSTLADGSDIAVGSTTGTKIGTAATQKLGFFGATPVVRPSEIPDELTALTQAGTFTPDYAIQAMTASSPVGFASADEAETVLSVVIRNAARIKAIEDALVSLGLLTDAD